MTRVACRPIGGRIHEVCQIAEKLGAASARQIQSWMSDDLVDSNVASYCSRAVGLKLMTVDRSVKPMMYRPVANWRALMGNRTMEAYKPSSLEDGDGIVAMAVRSQPNSVFALGARP